MKLYSQWIDEVKTKKNSITQLKRGEQAQHNWQIGNISCEREAQVQHTYTTDMFVLVYECSSNKKLEQRETLFELPSCMEMWCD